jgi:hypothetical protein
VPQIIKNALNTIATCKLGKQLSNGSIVVIAADIRGNCSYMSGSTPGKVAPVVDTWKSIKKGNAIK